MSYRYFVCNAQRFLCIYIDVEAAGPQFGGENLSTLKGALSISICLCVRTV